MSGVTNPNKIAQHGNAAHVPIYDGRSCRDCLHMIYGANAKWYGRCSKAMEFRHGTAIREFGKLDLDTPACKCFEVRPEGVKPWHGFRHDRNPVGDAGTPVAGDEEPAASTIA